MNPLLEVLCNEINKLKKALTTTGSDYTATVTKVEGDTAYVQMSGSAIADTPVSMTINAHVGDKVRVRVSNGRAWITGNDTAPPSDNKQVIEMIENNSQGLIETEAKYSRIDQTIDQITIEVGEVDTKADNAQATADGRMKADMSNKASSITVNSGQIAFNSNSLVVNSSKFTLDQNGNATFGGTLNAAGGSFTGEVRINGDYVESGDQTVFISPTGAAPIRVYAEPALNVDAGVTLGATDFRMTYDDNRLASELHNILTASAQSAAIRVRRNSSWTDYGYDGAHPSSDRRLKEDITELSPKAAKQLIPVRFRFKGDDKLHYGFIAQDVQRIIPDVVQESENGYLTLTYHELIAPLYALVQEQEGRISRLEARIEQLEKGDQE
jgi:hypothetical protein